MIELKSKMKGRYKLTAAKADANGDPIENTRRDLTGWFDNLITDLGLNAYGNSENFLRYCQVGTGSTSPSVNDTVLATHLANTSTMQSFSRTARSAAPYYLSLVKTFRFGVGAAEGNISEVGVGHGATNNLFSRALVLDGSQQPTSITVQADEVLDVTYELRIYPPTVDTSGTITLDGEVFDWVGRACNVVSVSTNLGWYTSTDGTGADYAYTLTSGCYAFDGIMGAIDDLPSGTSSNADSYGAVGNYSNDSFEREFSAQFNLNFGNVGGIRSIRAKMGFGMWQFEFSRQSDNGAIPKDDTKIFALNFKHSWARG